MILVTGATGNIGHALVDILVKQGAQVRAVVLKEDMHTDGHFTPPNITQSSVFPNGVEVVAGNLAQPKTMPHLFDNIEAVFVNPRALGAAIDEFLQLAKAHGVHKVVTLSASNVDQAFSRQPSRLNGDRNKEVETAVMNSGMDWTALRSSYYAMNTIGTWAPQIKNGNLIKGSYATWENTPLDERDVAAVAAQALLHDKLIGKRPVLTGPQSLSQAEMVSIIGTVIGRELSYQELPPEIAKQGMLQAGFSAAFVDTFLDLQKQDAGKTSLISNEIEQILGRPPVSFAEWATRHSADFKK